MELTHNYYAAAGAATSAAAFVFTTVFVVVATESAAEAAAAEAASVLISCIMFNFPFYLSIFVFDFDLGTLILQGVIMRLTVIIS